MRLIAFLFNWLVKITGFIPQLFAFRTKVTYEDRALQGRRIKGKAILISNHSFLTDFAAMMFVFMGRTLRCVTAELMYQKNIFMTLFLVLSGTVKVDRNTHDFSFIDKCKKILDKGGVIEIYPEARLPHRDEETPLPFKPSAVYLALESGAPIIPVYNNGKYFSKERNRVIIGKPILVSELYDPQKSEKDNITYITDFLRGKIIELRNELESQQNSRQRDA